MNSEKRIEEINKIIEDIEKGEADEADYLLSVGTLDAFNFVVKNVEDRNDILYILIYGLYIKNAATKIFKDLNIPDSEIQKIIRGIDKQTKKATEEEINILEID